MFDWALEVYRKFMRTQRNENADRALNNVRIIFLFFDLLLVKFWGNTISVLFGLSLKSCCHLIFSAMWQLYPCTIWHARNACERLNSGHSFIDSLKFETLLDSAEFMRRSSFIMSANNFLTWEMPKVRLR